MDQKITALENRIKELENSINQKKAVAREKTQNNVKGERLSIESDCCKREIVTVYA